MSDCIKVAQDALDALGAEYIEQGHAAVHICTGTLTITIEREAQM